MLGVGVAAPAVYRPARALLHFNLQRGRALELQGRRVGARTMALLPPRPRYIVKIPNVNQRNKKMMEHSIKLPVDAHTVGHHTVEANNGVSVRIRSTYVTHASDGAVLKSSTEVHDMTSAEWHAFLESVAEYYCSLYPSVMRLGAPIPIVVEADAHDTDTQEEGTQDTDAHAR